MANSSAHPSDQTLFARLRAGDESAFTQIYDRYWSSLYITSVRILEDTMCAKDVVQDVFVSFYQQAPQREIQNIRAYLFQAVKLRCFMQLRSGKISKKHLDQINHINVSNETEEALDAQELDLYLKKQIDLLPEKCREVFCLSRFEQLSNQKIAERLNISPKTVENQITKALHTLRMSVEKIALITFCFFF